jgi:hypothetical protein
MKYMTDQHSHKYDFLKKEAAAPYQGLRQLVYFVCGGSGAIGALIFFTQLLAGQDVQTILPNLALQLGVVALMIGLFRLERRWARRK